MAGEDLLASTLTSVGGEFGSALVNTGAQALLTKYNFDLNRQGIREQQEYNSPAAQMQRLTAAGLNPALVYGHGATATSPGTASAGGGGSAGADFLRAVDRAAGIRVANQQYVTQAIQQRLLESQIATQQATADKIKADTHAVKQGTDVWDNLDEMFKQSNSKGGYTVIKDLLLPILKSIINVRGGSW